ncbi:S24 family peptidase [Burkholderia orbicola]|uniref:S24 family peptidase n=1 Tax=Burkholderia orbicola TaxID=2978683 RepID=UPI00265544EA|nr:S24 family peptidase [Burkholderia orbicola]MDN7558197.1 S24 family peptidase [Burkholderia orbicola]
MNLPITQIRQINLGNALLDLRIKQTDLARSMGLPNPSIVNQHVRGTKNIGDKFARRYEAALGLAEFSLDQPPPESEKAAKQVTMRPVLAWDSEDDLGDDYALVPRLDVKASAGNGKIIWHVDEKGQRQAFRKTWLQRLGINPAHAATMVAEGFSMSPRIEDGDSLVVNYKDQSIISGKVYVLTFAHELFIKRLFRTPTGGIRIVSDNQDKARYPDWEVAPEELDNLVVIARVVGVSGAI